MATLTDNHPILVKTRELCEAILGHADFQAFRAHIDTFMQDEEAKQQYRTVAEKGEQLNQKQSGGTQLSDAEIADFESHRERLLNNPVARSFLDAQQQMQEMQQSIQKYVNRTIELGRVPAAEDFESCGHGCSCGH